MNSTRRKLLSLALIGAASPLVWADTAWPAGKMIRLIIPYVPGGDNDTTGRLVANYLGPALGTRIVVENKPGAATMLASEMVAKSPPDGYTLLWGAATHTGNAALYSKLPYDPIKDFVPIVRTAIAPLLVITAASSPFQTLGQFIEAARSDPKIATMASPGNGSSAHFAIEMFSDAANLKVTHIAYKGSAQAIVDVIGGNVSVGMHGFSTVGPQLKGGRVRALAAVSPKRLSNLPDVPTMVELGYPEVDTGAWFGLFAPAGTPAAIVNRLNAEVNRILQLPDVVSRFETLGVYPVGGSSEDFQRFIQNDLKKLKRIVQERGIKLES